jgi:hypothetical protein
MKPGSDPALAVETKALVALAFRNGPIEDVHAGKLCPTCGGQPEYSHVSDEQMKAIMKSAVSRLYSLLWQREHDVAAYAESLSLGMKYSTRWDDPEI